MSKVVTLRVRVRRAWWVRPAIAIARFNVSLGIPVDEEAVLRLIRPGFRAVIVGVEQP